MHDWVSKSLADWKQDRQNDVEVDETDQVIEQIEKGN